MLLRATKASRGVTEATHTLISQATPRTISAPQRRRARSCRARKSKGTRATCNVPTSATYRHPLGARSEDLVRHCLRLHLRDAVDLLELLEELGLGRVARLLPRAEGVERDLVRVGVRAGRVWESALPFSALRFIQGKCPFEAVASGDRRGELEVEAAAAHGAVDDGALERLKLGQVLVDEIGDLDEGRRASLACRWASMCVRVHRSGWPRRAAALGRSRQCRGAFCPETFTGSAATTVVLPLAAPLARNVLELHLAVGHWLGLGLGLGSGYVCGAVQLEPREGTQRTFRHRHR